MEKKGYHIDPPPKESGTEPLFRVVYAIDVSASDVKQAAGNAFKMMLSKDSFAPILVVLDCNGNQTTIDLSDTLEFNKITTGFVCQKYRKDESGKFVCIHQEFIAGDDVQFENVKGDPIAAPEHDYQPFNMVPPTATIVKEQCSDSPPVEIKVNILSEGGKIWIQPQGYGEKCTIDGEGFPIGIEIWQGKLRLIAFNDINSEDPQIISLENAKESCRIEDSQEGNCPSYCAAAEYLAAEGQKIFTGHMNGGLWNARCMDAGILSKKQNDKAAYELLIKYGDQYAQAISDEQKDVWQKIKESAAAMLNQATP
ncbi:MAG: hypothetical protein WC770_10020 [Phycisphaerae bacterium]|jgi:hypothetical protein